MTKRRVSSGGGGCGICLASTYCPLWRAFYPSVTFGQRLKGDACLRGISIFFVANENAIDLMLCFVSG